jgi:hypothetical protein
MKSLILDRAVHWAGDRIICVGCDLDRGDLPQNLLSTQEEEMLDRDFDEYPESNVDDRLETYCDTDISRSAFEPSDLLRRLVYPTHLPWQYQKTMLTTYISIGYRMDILRNISKRQYVRRRALRKMACPRHWHWDTVDLGHIVMSRICWSSDSSVAMSYKGDIHRGVWAGDRFDITSADALDEKDENGQAVEWTDVTDEVLKEMFEIWWCQYGGGTFRIHVFSLSPVWTDVHFPSER